MREQRDIPGRSAPRRSHNHHSPAPRAVPTMGMNDEVASVVEAWYAAGKPRKLSRRKLAFLEQLHDRYVADPVGTPLIADGFLCTELELPTGSSWQEVIASLLDHVEPLEGQQSRLDEVRELLPA